TIKTHQSPRRSLSTRFAVAMLHCFGLPACEVLHTGQGVVYSPNGDGGGGRRGGGSSHPIFIRLNANAILVSTPAARPGQVQLTSNAVASSLASSMLVNLHDGVGQK